MPFSAAVRQEVLVRSKRHCCVCEEFAGRSEDVHHIVPESEGGASDIENAIALCQRCHSEAGHYNPQHPLGNKYSRDELRRRRDIWWRWCSENPAAMPPKSPIAITPTTIGLSESEWRRRTIVVIHNQWTKPLFEIWVKCSLIGLPLLSEVVDISPIIYRDAVELSCASLTISGQVLGLLGTDLAGNDVQFLRFYNLDPGKTLKLQVVEKPRNTVERHDVELRFAITEFENEPRPLLEHQDHEKAAMTIKAPEEIQIRAIGTQIIAIGGQ